MDVPYNANAAKKFSFYPASTRSLRQNKAYHKQAQAACLVA